MQLQVWIVQWPRAFVQLAQAAQVDLLVLVALTCRSLALSWISLTMQYSTGTTSMVMTSMVIPPNEGMAIGTMMSEPRPFDVRMGSRARIVVAVVMRQGLMMPGADYAPALTSAQ